MDFLKAVLSPSRVAHSLRVAEEAERLAAIHGEDTFRAHLAGLLHDCARDLPWETLREFLPPYIQENDFPIPEVFHAFAAPAIIERELGLRDFRIFRAIRWHATGCEWMSALDRIVFVADIAEPGRDFPEAREIRQWAYSDLRMGYVLALRTKIEYLLRTYGVVALESLRSWNREIGMLRKEGKMP